MFTPTRGSYVFRVIRRIALMAAAFVFLTATPRLAASTIIFYSGNLRTDASVTSCGTGCT